MDFEENLKNLLWRLQDILENAPMEEDCTEKENTMYADMTNLTESINEYLEENRNK